MNNFENSAQKQYEEDDFYIAQQIHRNHYPEHSESRSEIQAHIAQLPAHESFDISSFAESRTATDLPRKNIRDKFPFSNAPTLNLHHKAEIHIYEDLQNENQQGRSGQKMGQISNTQIVSLLKRIEQLEQENQNLKSRLQQNDTQFEKFIRKIKELNQEKIKLEQQNLKKQAIIRNMENSMKGYKQKYQQLLQKLKMSRITNQNIKNSQQNSKNLSANHKNSERYESESRAYEIFSPQLMSPQQCYQIFIKLTMKLEKSYKIHRRLLKEPNVCQILSKILSKQ